MKIVTNADVAHAQGHGCHCVVGGQRAAQVRAARCTGCVALANGWWDARRSPQYPRSPWCVLVSDRNLVSGCGRVELLAIRGHLGHFGQRRRGPSG